MAKVVALPSGHDTSKGGLSQLDDLAQRLTLAVASGAPSVCAEAERGLAAIARATAATIVVNIGGFWRGWCASDEPSPDAPVFSGSDLPPDADRLDEPTFHAGTLFLPIRAGALAAIIKRPEAGRESVAALRVAAGCIDLALTTSEDRDPSGRTSRGLLELRHSANRLLAATGPEEIVLIASTEARRLVPADICAVLMRVGSEVLTRHCVGDFSLDTDKLHSEGNQRAVARVLRALQTLDGLAGHGSARAADEPLSGLLQTDKGQTLAAPIISHGDSEGTIELWRRSGHGFNSSDQARLLALAAVSSMALDNGARGALLSETLEPGEAEAGYRRFQIDLAGQLLLGNGLASIADKLAHYGGAAVSIVDADGNFVTSAASSASGLSKPDERLRRMLRTQLRSSKSKAIYDTNGSGASYPVILSGDVVGHILLIADAGFTKIHHLALNHSAVVAALLFQQQRVASEARHESVQTLIWDLLEGSEFDRSIAIERAREHGISTLGDCSVAIVALDNLEAIAAPQSSGRGFNRLVEIARTSQLGRTSHVIGLRGTELRVVSPNTDRATLLEFGDQLIALFRRELPLVKVAIGFSGASRDLSSLSTAYREARVALEVAQQQVGQSITHYSDVGLVGLLISLRSASDMRRVSSEILGAVLAQPDRARDTLLKTLTAFFDENCSQMGTAAVLGTHQKTVAYRLSKVSRLSGLNLSKHQDRVLADLAVRIFSMINMKKPAGDK